MSQPKPIRIAQTSVLPADTAEKTEVGKKRKAKKPSGPKKSEIVEQLYNSLSEEQWGLMVLLRGKPFKDTKESRINFLNNLITKGRKISSAKNIARDLQKWTEQHIGEALHEPFGKDTDICSREMGQSGPDVRLAERIYKVFKFTQECKSGNDWSLPAAIKQCIANLYPGTDWMVVLNRPDIKPDKRIPPVVCIDGEVFFKIWKDAYED